MNDEAQHSLTVTLRNTRPVELGDFTGCMGALADEYRRQIRQPDIAGDVRLYVKEMRQGSIVAQLVELMPYAMPFLADANTLAGFCRNMAGAFAWLKAGDGDRPELPKHTLENAIRIAEPTAKDPGGQMHIEHAVFSGPVTISFNNTEANAIQNRAHRELAAKRETTGGHYENMALRWYQARADSQSAAGDRAIIQAFSEDPVRALFATPEIKARMVLGQENPFAMAYIVDVHVQKIGDRPVLYTITDCKESLGKFPV